MAYDQGLAERLAERFQSRKGFTTRHMFGGKMWWYHGNILGGAHSGGLLVKIAVDEMEASLREPGVTAFCPGARPMKDWLVIPLDAVDSEEALDYWLNLALIQVKSLKPKG